MVFGQSSVASNGGTWFTAQSDELVLLLKSAHPLQQLALLDHRACDVGTGQSESGFNLSDHFGFQLIASACQQWAVHGRAAKRANRQEDRVCVTEIRTRILDACIPATRRSCAARQEPCEREGRAEGRRDQGTTRPRVPLKLRFRAPRKTAGSDGEQPGSRGSGPAMTLRRNADVGDRSRHAAR